MGDLLRIDLTTRTATEETLPPELIRDYIGAKGIGTHLLLEEVGPEVDPLSPQNKMFFCTGPLSGTTMFGGNRYAVYFASPLTGGYCECYSGGDVTPQFAKTGYKVVIVEGAADKPVYLEMSPSGVQFHDADDLWGLGTYDAEEQMVAATGVPKAQACVIGPAGENLVRFACIENNKWHSLGRGGPGAVMGSKKVKGIVFHGDKPVQVARPDEFKALVRDMAARGKDDPGVAAYRRGGTINMVRIMNGQNAFPTRYWRKGTARGLRSAHRRDDAREVRHQEQDLSALHHAVREAQHRPRRPAQGSADRGSRVRDALRVRRPVRDRRLRGGHVAQRHLRPTWASTR